jgi:hypothetical protein
MVFYTRNTIGRFHNRSMSASADLQDYNMEGLTEVSCHTGVL